MRFIIAFFVSVSLASPSNSGRAGEIEAYRDASIFWAGIVGRLSLCNVGPKNDILADMATRRTDWTNPKGSFYWLFGNSDDWEAAYGRHLRSLELSYAIARVQTSCDRLLLPLDRTTEPEIRSQIFWLLSR